MRILLLQDVRGVGKRNEVKTVSDGYARNLLIPKGLARVADENALAAKKALDWNQEAELLKLQSRAQELAQLKFQFTVNVGEHQEVFGSVSKKDIEKVLVERGFTEVHVELEHPIKATGEHRVNVSFGKGVTGSMHISISAA